MIIPGLVKFGGLAKLNLEELDTRFSLVKSPFTFVYLLFFSIFYGSMLIWLSNVDSMTLEKKTSRGADKSRISFVWGEHLPYWSCLCLQRSWLWSRWWLDHHFCSQWDTDISKVSQVGILQLAYWEFSLCYYKLKDILFSLQVHIIDTKNFSSEPVVKIRLPCRVPYGFHGAFMPMSLWK